jgi:autotransporter-associated beta strand protein
MSSGSITKQGSGTWTLSGVNVIPGAVTVNGGKLQLAANQTYGSLNVQSGAVAMTASPHAPHLLTTSALSIAAGTAVDLSDNDLTVNYAGQADPVSTVEGYLTTGYANGNWNGSGLTTSAAATNPGTTLGYIDNTTSSTVQVNYTWYGDLDLSGTVDNNDLMAMGNIPTTGANAGVIGWFDGDLNYDGKINQDDWALFQLGLAESKGASISSVPEPSTLGLLAAAGMMLSRKRRNQYV